MGYPNVMKEIGTTTVGLPIVALITERIISSFVILPNNFSFEIHTFGLSIALLGIILTIWSGYLLAKVGGISLNLALIWQGDTSNPWTLVTNGPYAFVRNPFVLGDILFLIGLGLFLDSSLLLLMVFFWWVVSNYKITHYEENNLTKRFGKVYIDYKGTVPRWFPKLPSKGQLKLEDVEVV
jgi:protein-S-isoprenylcysteine O-methyltransferase Ste14